MRLLHYTQRPFRFSPRRQYRQDDNHKPVGLWVSIDGEYDWKSWCEGEQWNTEALAHVTEVTLHPGHNVLVVSTLDALDEFHERFCGDAHNYHGVRWPEVLALYDGLIIAPYQWERRLSLSWYYTWDCASGCIWNLSVIHECVSRASMRETA